MKRRTPPAQARLKGLPSFKTRSGDPSAPRRLGLRSTRARARARALSTKTEIKLECRRLYLAAPASVRLLLEQTTTMLPSLSRPKEIFARASRNTEICTPQVDNFADSAKFTSISKGRLRSKKFLTFAPHMTSAKNRAQTSGAIILTCLRLVFRVRCAHSRYRIAPSVPILWRYNTNRQVRIIALETR